jgi:hypothetical protein
MELYITLKDLVANLDEYLERAHSEDERFIIQNDTGETLAVLCPYKVVEVIDALSKKMKVEIINVP